jgi:hypothetical protein
MARTVSALDTRQLDWMSILDNGPGRTPYVLV